MNPCVVVVNSCESISPESVIKGILEVELLPEPLVVLPEVRGYPWHITTKYYEADVHICSLDKKSIGTREFAESVNAVILPFDSSVKNGLAVAEQWLTFIDELEAEVKVLLCNNCAVEEAKSDPGHVSKLQAQNWCVKNGFELVELNPVQEEEDSEYEDDFPESTGIKRVVQALHAHVWPNLVMKDDTHRSGAMRDLQHALNGVPRPSENVDISENRINGDSCQDHPGELNGSRKKLIAEVRPLPKDSIKPSSNVAVVNPIVSPSFDSGDNDSAGSSGNMNPSSSEAATRPSPTRDERLDAMFQAMESMPEENFEQLFQNLSEMKSKAEKLSPRQRKAYAEKIAIAFWKSVGGNDSEVEGLSSDED